MKETKLIELLSTFTKSEIKDFVKFTESPYFMGDRNVAPLLNIIKLYYPSFDAKDFTIEKIYTKLYGNEGFNRGKIRTLISDLYKMAEEFLAHNRFKKNPVERELYISAELKERKLEKLFFKSLQIIEKKIEEKKFDSITGFSDREKTEAMRIEYYSGKNDWETSMIHRTLHAESFILTFFMKYLRAERFKYTAKKSYKYEIKNDLIEAVENNINIDNILRELKEKNYVYYPLLAMCDYVYKIMLDSATDDNYREFKNLVMLNMPLFNRAEKYMLMHDLIAYCIGKKELTIEALDLYMFMLDNNIYSMYENEYMQALSYRTFIYIATSVQKYGIIEEFVQKHTDKLKPEYRENMKYYAYAFMYFSKKEFEKSLVNISKVKYQVFLFKIDVKNLMLKIFYELNLYEQAVSMLDTYKHYIQTSEEVSEYIKSIHSNFVKIYSRLIKVKSTQDKKELDIVEIDAAKNENTASRKWLLEKLNELQKEKK